MSDVHRSRRDVNKVTDPKLFTRWPCLSVAGIASCFIATSITHAASALSLRISLIHRAWPFSGQIKAPRQIRGNKRTARGIPSVILAVTNSLLRVTIPRYNQNIVRKLSKKYCHISKTQPRSLTISASGYLIGLQWQRVGLRRHFLLLHCIYLLV